MMTGRHELGWYDLDALEKGLQRLTRDLAALNKKASHAMERSSELTGTKGFAPLVASALAVEALTAGVEAQIQHIAHVVAASKAHVDRKTAATPTPTTTAGDDHA